MYMHMHDIISPSFTAILVLSTNAACKDEGDVCLLGNDLKAVKIVMHGFSIYYMQLINYNFIVCVC